MSVLAENPLADHIVERPHRSPLVTNSDMATLARLAAWGEWPAGIHAEDFPIYGQFALAGLIVIRSDGAHLTDKGRLAVDRWLAMPADWTRLT